MATSIGAQGLLHQQPKDLMVFEPAFTFSIAPDGSKTEYYKRGVRITIARNLALILEKAKKGKILGRPEEVAASDKKAIEEGDEDEQEGDQAPAAPTAPLSPTQVTAKAKHINTGKDALVVLAVKEKLGTAAELGKLNKDQIADKLARLIK